VTTPVEQAARDSWSPRPADLPTEVPLEGPLDSLDAAKVFAAPDDPQDWPSWREALTRWRSEAAERVQYDGSAYARPEFAWTQRCFAVALAWLWDELLYDHESRRFTPERYCGHAAREFGGLDGIVLWHAYPIIGLDERNQFDFYRDVTRLPELVAAFRERGVRVFLDYNPWDVGTRREPDDAVAIAELVRDLGADGVFLDTMKTAPPGLREAVDAVRPGIAFEGESTVPLERVCDHHLSWAQWFADSAVPGVLRARWFEQRHLLHQTRRWNRDHGEELASAWLNGVGLLIWENVFGSWVGWSERDKAVLRAILPIQREHAALLATGEWTPLAASAGSDERPRVVASRWTDGSTTLWAIVNRGDEAFEGALGGGGFEVVVPAWGVAAVVDGVQIAAAPGDQSVSFAARTLRRIPAPSVAGSTVPAGFVEAVRPAAPLTAVFRRRETGSYGEAPFVDEWKPLPPRLHALEELTHEAVAARRFAVGRHEVTNAELGLSGAPDAPATGVSLAEARAFAASLGARLPTEDEWQLAAQAGLLERLEPLVWNWTESEHSDGRTRFVVLKGGSAWRAEGSDWYVDGGPQEPAYSLKLLLAGDEIARSPWIGFRLAVDL
jgi:hypothetical protein